MHRVNAFFQELLEHGCLECLVTVLLDIDSKMAVLAEVTAALAVMADDGKKYNSPLVRIGVATGLGP